MGGEIYFLEFGFVEIVDDVGEKCFVLSRDGVDLVLLCIVGEEFYGVIENLFFGVF